MYVGVVLDEHSLDFPEDKRFAIFAQRRKTSVVNRKLRVGAHFIAVHHADIPQPVAFRASAARRVEREIVGSGLFISQSCSGTHQTFAQEAHSLVVAHIEYNNKAITLF